MNMTPERKEHIDSMSYEDLLRRWRFTPMGNPWFCGETGTYITQRMAEIVPENYDEISKKVGWTK